MKCPKCSAVLNSVLTRSSVLIDVCSYCKGTWLDQGELNFFVKNKNILDPYHKTGLLDSKETLLSCPKCSINLNAGKIPGFKHEVEECPSCHGLWLDEHEFKKIIETPEFQSLAPDRKVSASPPPVPPKSVNQSPKFPATLLPALQLPSLKLTSTLVLGSLYAVLFGVMVLLIELGMISESFGVILAIVFVSIQFFFGPILMDFVLRFFGSLDWVSLESLPESLRRMIIDSCKMHQIPIPKIGIINDLSPQAYTYGRTPGSARLVLSRGIIEILEPDESEAVVAHELGHVVHWDFVFMTVAQFVPMLLYQIYRTLRSQRKGGNRKGNGAFVIASIVAYMAYLITEYLVLFLSRVREYWADRFSVDQTKNPNALIRALTKIAYGMVSAQKNVSPDEKQSTTSEKTKLAMQSMGIMSVLGSKELVLYGTQGENTDSRDLKEIMRWDLWTPWATYYELNSTHPLIAKRINAISSRALSMGIEPEIKFDLQKPESYWDEFLKDLFIILLPIVGALIAIAPKVLFAPWPSSKEEVWHWLFSVTIGICIGGMIKTIMIYPQGSFSNYSIRSLLKIIKVSPVTTYPVKIKGKVIGRGDPGNIFSEDMVVRDSTGMIFLDYQHGISNWYFAYFKIDKFIGNEVEIEGWYRRSPIPFIEIKTIRTATETARSYSFYYALLSYLILPLLVFAIKIGIHI